MAARPDPFAVALRPMREKDVAAVMDVESAAYRHPWTEGIFRDCLRVGYCCWVAEGADGVAGYFVMAVAAGESHLLNLCVSPARQGQGLGRRLLRQAMHLARSHDASSMFLEVRPSNERALVLYRDSGFVEAGIRRGYYPTSGGGREDAVVLSILLG